MASNIPAALVSHTSRRGVWRNYDVTTGMLGGVTQLHQDARGYLWLTTFSGLCRFDGRDFTYFSSAHGLPRRPLSGICEDREGRIWVGSLGGGICCFDGERASVFSKADGLVDNDVIDIQFDTQGRLWIATWNHGASCYENGKFTNYTTADGLGENSLRTVLCDRHGNVWFGTNATGVSRFDGQSFTTFRREDGLLHNRVQCLAEDGHGRIWMGTAHGLSCYNGETIASLGREDGLPERNVRCIYEDDEGTIWLGFQRVGLAYLHGDRVSVYSSADGMLHNNVSAILRDREGLLWCGHAHVGLSCLDIQSVEPLTDSPITEVMTRDHAGRIWFGCDNEIVCIDRDGCERRQNLRYRVYAILEDRLGRLWVGTGGMGLLRYETTEEVWDQPPEVRRVASVTHADIISLCETRNGDVWVGTAHPGQLIRFREDAPTAYATSNLAIFRMTEDEHGHLWFCGGGAHWAGSGITRFDGTSFVHFAESDGLVSDGVKSLLVGPEKRLWIGTQYGLCVMEQGRIAPCNTDTNGFAPDHQCAAVDSRGHLWFGTLGAGVYRYNGKHFQRLTTENGLPSNEITGLLPEEDGSVLIGTFRGLVRYRPMASRAPLLEVRKVLADRVYTVPRQLELTTTQAHLVTVVYQGTSLSAHRLRYSYMLENHDADWKDTWLSEVTFENLPIGDYTFLLRAVNRDFIASANTAALQIRVTADPLSRLLAEHQAEIGRMEQEMKSRRQSERLNHALAELVRSKTLDEDHLVTTLRRITEVVSESLEVQATGIWLSDTNGIRIRCVERYEHESRRHSRGEEVLLTSGMNDFHALQHERVVSISDVFSDERTAGIPEAILPRAATSALLTAVWQGGRFAGLVVSTHFGSRRKWSNEERNFAGFISDFVALAFERGERRRAELALHETQEEDRRFQGHLMALHQLTNDLNKLETFDEICRMAIHEGCKRLEFESLSLWFKDTDLEYLVGSYSTDEFGRLRDRRGERAPARAPWLFGRPADNILGADLIKDAPLYNERGEFVRMGTRAVASLWDGEDVTGYLVTDNLPQGRPITEHQSELLGLFASALGHLASRRRADEERRHLEAQIQQSQRLESLGVLAGGIAHDFNNILAAIFGHATLAMEEALAESLVSISLEQILRAGMRAKELVQQILAFSRREEQEFKPVALNQIVEETLQFARASLPSPIEIVRNINAPSAFIRGNPTQLHQVVMNLCANAGQAIGDRSGTIELTLETCEVAENLRIPAELKPGTYVKLSVRDSGCGIAPEVAERIFEPFFTTKSPGQGTGMGLAVVHGIVASHGGAIGVESALGKGTTFHIFFPRIEEPAATESRITSKHPTGTEHILFVDDEDSLIQLGTRLLSHLGYQVTTANDGEEALALFRAQPEAFDLLVTDRLMPKMTGEVLARRVTTIRPELPVLLTTGHFDYIAQDQVRALGISEILPKPYTVQQLSTSIRSVLDQAKTRS